MDSGDRSFTIDAIYKAGKKIRYSGGRYISSTPSSAAKKAFSQYYRTHKIKGKVTLEIHIKETTNGSAHKTYKYKVSKLKQINEVIRNGEKIVYSYITKIKAL
jgi:hypothetical protein